MVLTSTLGQNDKIVFAYETGGQQTWTVVNGGTYSYGATYLGKASFTVLPSTTTGSFVVEANRPAGAKVWLQVTGGTAGDKTEWCSPDVWAYPGTSVADGSLATRWTVTPNNDTDTVTVTLRTWEENNTSLGVKVAQHVASTGSGNYGIGSGTVTYPDAAGQNQDSKGVNGSYYTSNSSAVNWWPNDSQSYSWTREGTLEGNKFAITDLFNLVTNGANSLQQPVRMYIKYNDIQSGQPVEVNIPFPSSVASAGDTVMTNTLTNGDLNGMIVKVTRQESDRYSIGSGSSGFDAGYNHYSFEFQNIKTSFELHIVYEPITTNKATNTRVAAVSTQGVDARIKTMNGLGSPTAGIDDTAFTAGNVYTMKDGWNNRISSSVVRIDFTLQDDYYNPKVYITDTGNERTSLPVYTSGSGYYVTFQPQDSKTTSVMIETDHHTWQVRKNMGEATSWTWPGGSVGEPNYSGYVLSTDNNILPISSAIPSGKDASGNPLYFKGWKIEGNSVNKTFNAGTNVNMFDKSQVNVNGENTSPEYQFTLVAQWDTSPADNDPVNASYTVLKRNKDNGQDEDTYSALLAWGQQYNLSADSTITDGTNKWILYGVKDGELQDGKVQGTFTGTLPTFVYEHVQEITFTKDQGNSNDKSGKNLGNINVQGNEPNSSEGLSFIQTAYITRDGQVFDSYSDAENAGTVNPAYTAQGYEMIGWRGKNSGTNYLFDEKGIAEVQRAWGDMILEPVWEQSVSHVTFSLAGMPAGSTLYVNGSNTGSQETYSADKHDDLFTYELSTSNGERTIGDVPTMFSRGDGSPGQHSRTLDFWAPSAGQTTVDYIAGWKIPGTNYVVKSGDSIDDLIANGLKEDQFTDVTYTQYVDSSMTGTSQTVKSYVLEPIWVQRSFDGAFGVEEGYNDTPTSDQLNGATLTNDGDGTWTLTKDIYADYTSDDLTVNMNVLAKNIEQSLAAGNDGVTVDRPAEYNTPRIVEASNTRGANNPDGRSFTVRLSNDTGADKGASDGYNNLVNNNANNIVLDKSADGGNAAAGISIKLNEPTSGKNAVGEYRTTITIEMDSGDKAGGWNYSRDITLDVVYNIKYKNYDFGFADINYETEYLTFTGANASGATLEGVTGVQTVPEGDTPTVNLTSTLDGQTGTGTFNVTMSRPTENGYEYKEETIAVPKRQAAVTQDMVSVERTVDNNNNGTITVTARDGDPGYQIRSANGEWEDMTKADNGTYTKSGLGVGTYQVRVKWQDHSADSITDGKFASAPLDVSMYRQYTTTFDFAVSDLTGDAKQFVKTKLEAQGEDNTAAQAALKDLFSEGDKTTFAGYKVEQIINHWDALVAAMPGYTLTVTQQPQNRTYSTKPAGSGELAAVNQATTVTFTFTRSSATLNLNYDPQSQGNAVEFGTNVTADNWKSRALTFANGTGTVGNLPQPSAGGNSWTDLEFWKDGYKFEGWYTQDGTDGNWGTKVETNTDTSTILSAGETSATLYAKWTKTTYTLNTPPISESKAYNSDYGTLTSTVTVDNNAGPDGVATPRVLGVQITAVTEQYGNDGATDVASGEFSGYFTLTAPTATQSSPANVGTGIDVTVQPDAGLTPGVYTATVTLNYDGGANYTGLDMGENVKSDAKVNFTFTVTAGENAEVEFGTVDYVRETVDVVGAQAPKTVDEAVDWAKNNKLSIEGLPEGYDLTDETNWTTDPNTGVLELVLTKALDTTYDANAGTDGWASDGGQVTLSMKATPDNFATSAEKTVSFNVRAKGPEQSENSDPRAKGEGAKAVVEMAALNNAADSYEHQHSDGSWLAFNDLAHGSDGNVSAYRFTDPAGDYPVRVKALASTNDVTGHFASRATNVTIEQWYKVTIALDAKDWNDNTINLYDVKVAGTDASIGQQIGHYTGSGAMVNLEGTTDNDIFQLNANERGWNEYKTNDPDDKVYDAMYVPANAYYQLPVFGNVDAKSWETPGYDLTSITQNDVEITSADGTTGNADPYALTQSNAITGDTTITLHFEERSFYVAWDVRGDENVEATWDSSKTPSTQLIPWTEMVRTSMLNNWYGGSAVGGSWASESEWADAWFADGVTTPIDPVTISWEGFIRDPWALYDNNGNYTGFQVAQRMSTMTLYDPTTFMQISSDGSDQGNATSWRNADRLTFGALYHENDGQYGVRFKISEQDWANGFTVGNEGWASRTSVSNSQATPTWSDVKYGASNSSATAQDQKIPDTNYVFSGWFFDPEDSNTTPAVNDGQTGNFNSDWVKQSGTQNIRWTSTGTTNSLLASVYGALPESTSVRVNNRPYPINTGLWNTEFTPEGDASSTTYGQYHFPDFVLNGFDADNASTFPNKSKVDLTARIENANLTYASTLVPSADEEDVNISSGTVTVKPEQLWTDTTDGQNAEEGSITNTPSFKLLGVSQHDVVNPYSTSGEEWLTVEEVANKSVNTTDGTSFTITPNKDLKPGTYSTIIHLSYGYTSTTGHEYGADDGLYIHIPVTFTVTEDDGTIVDKQDGDWMASANNYVTTRAAAANELNSSEAIAEKMGLTVYHKDDNGNWQTVGKQGTEAATEDLSYTVTTDPSSFTGEEGSPVTVKLTVTGNDGASSTETTVERTVTLFDGGGGDGAVKVFANNADITLPDKDSHYDSKTEMTWLATQMGAAAYDSSRGYTKVDTSFSVTDDACVAGNTDLQAAGPYNVYQGTGEIADTNKFTITFSGGGGEGSATVTLVKAEYPGAPGEFTWNVDDTTANTLAWNAATSADNVAIARTHGYEPAIGYRVEAPDGATSDVNGTTCVSLNSNTGYVVKAYYDLDGSDDAASKVYKALDWNSDTTGKYTLISGADGVQPTVSEGKVWTRPADPQMAGEVTYDYTAETATYNDTYEEGTQHDKTVANVTLTDNLDEVTAQTQTNDALSIVGRSAVSGLVFTVMNNGDQGVAAQAEQSKSVGTLAGTQGVERTGSSDVASGTFDVTATGKESTLTAVNTGVVSDVPLRAATPALSIQQPVLSTDPAVVTGFDPEYIDANATDGVYGSLYQVRIGDDGEWGSISFAEDGTATIAENGTISLKHSDTNGYYFEIPAGYKGGDLQFRVKESGVVNSNNASTNNVAAHFASAALTQPVNGDSFNVTEGAWIDANNFEVGVNELEAWGFTDSSAEPTDEQGFLDAAVERSVPTINNSQDGMSYELDYTKLRAAEGTYTVTWNLVKDGTILSSKDVTVTVKTYRDEGDPNAYIQANSFVIGLSELEDTSDWNGLRDLAWARSGANGVETDGITALNAGDITFVVEGAADINAITTDASPYTVHFRNDGMLLNATVQMYVYDNIGGQDDENAKYIIASNNFTAGENELVDSPDNQAKLTEAAAINRADVTLFAKSNPAVPIDGTTTNVGVDLNAAWNAQSGTVVADGAKFTATGDAASTASDITVLGNGIGDETAAYQIYANDFVIARNTLTNDAANNAAKMFTAAGVQGKNNNTTLVAEDYGETWTVEVTDPNGAVLDQPETWGEGPCEVTFSLNSPEDGNVYTAKVQMTLKDSGNIGPVQPDGSQYALFSDNFRMDDSDYNKLFGEDAKNAGYTDLRDAANIDAYKIENGKYTLIENWTGYTLNVDTANFPESACIAGTDNNGPVKFTLQQSTADLANAQSFIGVDGGYTENEHGTIIAQHFIIDIDELDGIKAGEAITVVDGNLADNLIGYARANAQDANGADLAITSVTPGKSGETFTAGATYDVTFTAGTGEATVSTTVEMTVFDNVITQNGYTIASNDFEASVTEASENGIGNDELIKRGQVTVYNESDLQTPIFDYATSSLSEVAVDDTDFRNASVGTTSVGYTYPATASSDTQVMGTSNVTIYADGSQDQNGDWKIYANGITMGRDEGKNFIDATTLSNELITRGVQTATIDGAVMTPAQAIEADTNPISVSVGTSATGEFAELTASSINWDSDGCYIRFTIGSANDGTLQEATVPLTITDNAGAWEDTTTNSTYRVFSDDFNMSVDEGEMLADKAALFERANVSATVTNADGVTSVIAADQIDFAVSDELQTLTARKNPYADGVSFWTPVDGAEGQRAQTASDVTVYSTGGTDDEGSANEWYLYANDFTVTRDTIAGKDANSVEETIRTYSGLTFGPGTSMTVKINAGTTEAPNWQTITDFITNQGNAWANETYQVQFTYGSETPSYEVTMTVKSQYSETDNDRVAIGANDFAVSLEDLDAIQETKDARNTQLIDWASAEATLDGVKVADSNIGVTLKDADGASAVDWPTVTGTYKVEFSASDGAAENPQTSTVTVTMTVFGNSSEDAPVAGETVNPIEGTNYTVFSDDFALSIEEIKAYANNDDGLNQMLINYGNATSYKKGNTAVEAGTVYVANKGELANPDELTSGQVVRVAFGVQEEQGVQSVSDVTIYSSGGTHPDVDNPDAANKASIRANDIYITQKEFDAIQNGQYEQLLMDESALTGTDKDGNVLKADSKNFAVNVATMVDNRTGEVTLSEPVKDDGSNLRDGVQLQFTHKEPITHTGSTRMLDALVTLNISDSGQVVTDDETKTTYRMQSDNVRWLVENVDELRDETDNHATLRAQAGAVAISKVGDNPAHLLNGVTNIGVNANALGATGQAIGAGNYDVIFTNIAAPEGKQPTSTSVVSLYNSGGTSDYGDYLWANDIYTTYANVKSSLNDMHRFIYAQSGAVVGNLATGDVDYAIAAADVTIYVKANNQWINVNDANALEEQGFDNWTRSNYEILIQYKGVEAEIDLNITESQTTTDDGIKIGASSFATSTALVDAANNNADTTVPQWLVGQAKAWGTINNVAVGSDKLGITLAGADAKANGYTMPTEPGTYDLTFTLANESAETTEGTEGMDGRATTEPATITVKMTVYDNSSMDPDPTPETDDPTDPDLGWGQYVIFSNDFTVTQDKRDGTGYTDEELIALGEAKAYLAGNLYEPMGTVQVTQTGKDALAAAKPGETFAMPYTIAEDTEAQSVSDVTMVKSGSESAKASVYANDFGVVRGSEATQTLDAFRTAAFVGSGAFGTAADGSTLDVSDVDIYVAGKLINSAAEFSNIDWSQDSLPVTFTVLNAPDATAQVTMLIRDSGTSVVDPENPGEDVDPDVVGKASIFANDFDGLYVGGLENADEKAMGTYLYEQAKVFGTQVSGVALDGTWNPDQVAIAIKPAGSNTATPIADVVQQVTDGTWKWNTENGNYTVVFNVKDAEGNVLDNVVAEANMTLLYSAQDAKVDADNFAIGIEALTNPDANIADLFFTNAGAAGTDIYGQPLALNQTIVQMQVADDQYRDANDLSGYDWEPGTYKVKFTVNGTQGAAGEKAVTVDMMVFDNTSDDAKDDDPATLDPISSTDYAVFSNDFRIAEDAIGTTDDAGLIDLANAKAYEKSDLATELTGLVVDRTQLKNAKAGQTVQVAFGYQVDGTTVAQSVSNVTVYSSGSGSNTGDPTDPYLYANSFIVERGTLQGATASEIEGLILTNSKVAYGPSEEMPQITLGGKSVADYMGTESFDNWNGDSYNVTLTYPGETKPAATIKMNVYDHIGGSQDPTAPYIIAANNFNASEQEAKAEADGGLSTAQLIERGKVAVYDKNNMATPVVGYGAGSTDGIDVTDTNFRNKTEGQAASVNYAYAPASGSAVNTNANVSIYAAGSQVGEMSVYAGDVYATEAEVTAAATDDNALATWLKQRAGANGTDANGAALTMNEIQVGIGDTSTAPTVGNVKDGATVVFYAEAGGERVTAEATVHIYDNGITTGPTADGTMYGMYSNNAEYALPDLADLVGSDQAKDNYPNLRNITGAVAFVKNGTQPTQFLDGSDSINGVEVITDDLASATSAGDYDVTFRNIPSVPNNEATSVSVITLRDDGGIEPIDPTDPSKGEYFLFADNFTVDGDDLATAQAGDGGTVDATKLAEFLMGEEQANVSYGGLDASETVAVSVWDDTANDGQGGYVDLATYVSDEENAKWLGSTYNIKFTYGDIDAEVTMTVTDAAIDADNFAIGRDDLLGKDEATVKEAMYKLANVAGRGYGVTGELRGYEDVAITVNGVNISEESQKEDGWSADSYEVTFSVSWGKVDDSPDVSKTVTMSVYDQVDESQDGSVYLRANNFTIDREHLVAVATTTEGLTTAMRVHSGAVFGNTTEGDKTDGMTVEIDINGDGVYESAEEIINAAHTWNRERYNVVLSYEGLSVPIVMTVASDMGESGNVDISAFNFATSVEELTEPQSYEGGYAQWLIDKARINATINGAPQTDGITVEFNGNEVGESAPDDWPSDVGEYTFTYTVSVDADENNDGKPDVYASANAIMTVYDNSSEDTEGGSGDLKPVAGDKYAVYANNFVVTMSDIAAGFASGVPTPEFASQLISDASAVAFEKKYPSVPAGTVVVKDASSLPSAQAGDVVPVAFGVAEDGTAQVVAMATVVTDGMESADGSYEINANDVTLARESIANMGDNVTQLKNALIAGGVYNVVIGGNPVSIAEAINKDFIKVLVPDGNSFKEISAMSDINTALDEQPIRFQVTNGNDQIATADVTLYLTDNGGTGWTDNEGNTYKVYSNNFNMVASEYGTLFGGDTTNLYDRAGVRATITNADGVTTPLAVGNIGFEVGNNLSATQPPATGTYEDAVTFFTPTNAAGRATSASTVTVFDEGVPPAGPGDEGYDPDNPANEASIFGNNFSALIDEIHGFAGTDGNAPDTNGFGDYLYKQAGIEGTTIDGADLPDTYDPSKVAIAVNGTPLADVDPATIQLGHHTVTYTLVGTDKSIDVDMHVRLTNDPVSITAGEVNATQDELREASEGGVDSLHEFLVDRAGVEGTDADGAPLTPDKVVVTIDHDNDPATPDLTLEELLALPDFDWTPGTYNITFAVEGAEGVEGGSVTTTLVVTGSGSGAAATDQQQGNAATQSDENILAKTGDMLGIAIVALLAVAAAATLLLLFAWRRRRSEEEE